MWEHIARILKPLPLLRATSRPWPAFVLGFLFSGISGRVPSWDGCGGFSEP